MLSKIYAITPDNSLNIHKIEKIIRQYNITILQYRRKINSFNTKIIEAKALLILCKKLKVVLIINDDINLAKIIGADGIHLGKEDKGITFARSVLGDNAIIGVSCYNDVSMAINAEKLGANYCAFGSVFPSKTKINAASCSLETISKAYNEISIPIVGIGGINFDNYKQVLSAGANSVAMITCLWQSI